MSEATIAGEILATITSSGAAVKSVMEAIKAAKGKAKGNKEALAALLDAQELALSLQTSLFEAKEQALALQEENRELRAKVRQHEEWTLDQEKYERRKVGQGTVVVAKEDPETFLCPTCFAKDELSYLSTTPGPMQSFVSHTCPTCEATFLLR